MSKLGVTTKLVGIGAFAGSIVGSIYTSYWASMKEYEASKAAYHSILANSTSSEFNLTQQCEFSDASYVAAHGIADGVYNSFAHTANEIGLPIVSSVIKGCGYLVSSTARTAANDMAASMIASYPTTTGHWELDAQMWLAKGVVTFVGLAAAGVTAWLVGGTAYYLAKDLAQDAKDARRRKQAINEITKNSDEEEEQASPFNRQRFASTRDFHQKHGARVIANKAGSPVKSLTKKVGNAVLPRMQNTMRKLRGNNGPKN